jgi:serine/threonine-protein kinase
MGDIYLATDETLGREVVLKVLSDRYSADEAITARFKREGLAAARLSGESGAVTIFDVGEWRGRPFIVMEHLGGGSLEDRLREEGAQPPSRALAWLEQAASPRTCSSTRAATCTWPTSGSRVRPASTR